MNRFIPLLVLALVAVALAVTVVTPAKVNLPKATTEYFGRARFLHSHYTDTLRWSSDRSFADSTRYDVAVFVSGRTTTGILRANVLDDSSIVVVSNVDTDSALAYFYQVFVKAK